MPSPAVPPIAAPMGALRTERLRLTPFTEDEAGPLAPVFAERAVWEYPYGHGMDAAWTERFAARASAHWARCGFGLWVARTLTGEQPLGYLGLSMPAFLAELVPADRMPAVEVGWRLHPAHWGCGYAGEGARAALSEAFTTLQLTEVCSAPQTINAASRRVAERIGMAHERTATLAATDTRDAVEVDLYWIDRARWRSSSRPDRR